MSVLVNPYQNGGFPQSLLQSITAVGLTSNLQLAVDAADSSSYTSGATWSDTSGNGMDFTRATPTFNGSAGSLSSANYWSFGGADIFTRASNPAWIQNVHKNNATFTIAMAIMPVASTFWLCGDTGAQTGFTFRALVGGNFSLNILNSGANALLINSTVAATLGAWNVIAVSVNEPVGVGGGLFYANGASESFNATYSSPSASNAFAIIGLCARDSTVTSQAPPAGVRFGWCAMWSSALSQANLDSLFEQTRGRYSI